MNWVSDYDNRTLGLCPDCGSSLRVLEDNFVSHRSGRKVDLLTVLQCCGCDWEGIWQPEGAQPLP